MLVLLLLCKCRCCCCCCFCATAAVFMCCWCCCCPSCHRPPCICSAHTVAITRHRFDVQLLVRCAGLSKGCHHRSKGGPSYRPPRRCLLLCIVVAPSYRPHHVCDDTLLVLFSPVPKPLMLFCWLTPLSFSPPCYAYLFPRTRVTPHSLTEPTWSCFSHIPF